MFHINPPILHKLHELHLNVSVI